jgi:hypothetical protein
MRKILSIALISLMAGSTSACAYGEYDELYSSNCHQVTNVIYDSWGNPHWVVNNVCDRTYYNDPAPYIEGGAMGFGLGALLFNREHHDYDGWGHREFEHHEFEHHGFDHDRGRRH